ncbi:hypothetical protein ACETK8_12595 [Brevundimonas staleyi]|uniref:RiboL-PSP-HEPN domain-containing protein n=1 Tax=Brevundimonas staleyi TaxID=74326 RepID=A0ABW0FLF1_9CAUL
MSDTPKPRRGSESAQDIYLSVGLALSWWEAAEDVLMGVFSFLCSKVEPTAFDTYVAGSRSVRSRMLLVALNRYQERFTSAELGEIRAAMKALDRLALMRNQIAHGHVGSRNSTVDGVVVMEGHFLLPSLNEVGHHIARDFRYSHTAADIDEWRDRVRAERARIMDAEMGARMRDQEVRMAMSSEDRL